MRISQYTTEYTATLDTVDIKLDLSHDTDGLGAWVTKYIRGSQLMTAINNSVNNIYSANGSFSAARTITNAGFDLYVTGTGRVAFGASDALGYKLRVVGGAAENAFRADTANTSNALVVIDDGSEAFVGIRTSAPTEAFQNTSNSRLDGKVTRGISSASSLSSTHLAHSAHDGMITQMSAIAGNPYHSLYRTRGTIGAPSANLTNDIIGEYIFTSYGAGTQDAASIRAVAVENHGATSMGTEIQYYTASIGSSNPTQKAVLTADGWMGFGTTSPGAKVHIVGDAYVTTYMGIGVAPSSLYPLYIKGSTAPGNPLIRLEQDTAAAEMIQGYNSSGNFAFQLGLDGSNNAGFQFANSAGSSRVLFAASTNDNFVLDGDTGFGTSTPTEKVDVIGSIKASGSVRWSGGVGYLSYSGGANVSVNATAVDLIFRTSVATDEIRFQTGGTDRLAITQPGIGIGTSIFGTSATQTVAQISGVAPTTSPVDTSQMYVNDWNGALTAAHHFRNEEGHVIKMIQSAAYTATATAVIDRTLLASASATTLNNNNVLAAILSDMKANGLFG